MALVPVDITAVEAGDATGTLAGDAFDLCVLDEALPEADKTAIVAAARAARSPPLVFAAMPRGRSAPGQCRRHHDQAKQRG